MITKHESKLSSHVEQVEANEFLTSAPMMLNGQAKPVQKAKGNTKLDEIE